MKLAPYLLSLIKSLVSSPSRKIAFTGVILGTLYALHSMSRKTALKYSNIKKVKTSGQGEIDSRFLSELLGLVKIVIPSVKSKEAFLLLTLSVLLVARTMLSISISSLNGEVVKSIVTRDFNKFLNNVISNQIAVLAMYSMPSSLVNSGLDFLSHKLGIIFRTRMTHYMNQKYLRGLVFYQICNLDSRIANTDQRLTQDIEKWATCLSNLYSNLTKPVLDIFLFSKKLADLVGWEGPGVIIGWYFLSGTVIRYISPPFTLLTAKEQQNESFYRACQSDLVNHAEEIAFYQGQTWEKQRVEKTLDVIVSHINSILNKRFFMGTFDSMLVKYGATMVAYAVLGLPVFGPKREKYLNFKGMDTGNITRDYIRNTSLLINLAKAIGRLVVSYKDIQSLSGYTSLISETKTVLEDLEKGNFMKMIELKNLVPGEYVLSDRIEFVNVPIISPNGDLLVKDMNFKIEIGMHTFIQGPNGCGKSSLFRILAGLWPVFSGTVYKPSVEGIFYLPQRPYFTHGSLRDQIIYPHTEEQMKNRGVDDEDLEDIMKTSGLEEIFEKKSGLDQVEDWNDCLTAGQKQRIAVCRLIYHKPKFAVLDECTSSIISEEEGYIFEYIQEIGITLITVSHRESLMKYHKYLLKMDGEGGWKFCEIII